MKSVSYLAIGLLVFGSVGLSSSARAADGDGVPIPRFSEVSPGIYRGALPELQGLMALRELHFKSIVNLDDHANEVHWEKNFAEALGFDFEQQSLSGFFAPKDKQVEAILAFIANPANHPVFVHCHHGEDRTGMIVGLYRALYEKKDPQAAYQEALDHGFHPLLLGLNSYFRAKLGLR